MKFEQFIGFQEAEVQNAATILLSTTAEILLSSSSIYVVATYNLNRESTPIKTADH